MSQKPSKMADGSAASRIAASRFSNFETDPRFRLPSKRKTKTTIDKRFSRMLKDDEFTATTKVDRYGRRLKSDSKKKALERLYQEEDKEDIEVDDDEAVRRELRAADAKYDAARGGGFSSSESDNDSEYEELEGAVDGDVQGSIQKLQDEQAGVETGEVTNRIAIVNLDWDHIKAADLFSLFSSFLPKHGGKVEKVSIYPSEFGKERMQKEELDGPPREIFRTSSRQDEGEDSENSAEESGDEAADKKIRDELIQEGDDQDFDHDALRSYQLDRLRYYYAVMICSDEATAKCLYDSTDGSEYQASSNILDLRFIPNDVTFDDEPREECDSIPTDYKPVDFTTDALQHSKVKLTWDMTPDEMTRKDTIRRKFKGSREEIEKNDLRAYLASGSEDDENANEGGDTEEPKLTKKELARRKMRAALGLSDEPSAKSIKGGPVGDMEITFTSALSERQPEKGQEETTIDKYKRKEKERKDKKRENAKSKRESRDPDAPPESKGNDSHPTEDLGFDDPFFTTEDPTEVNKSVKGKKERHKNREDHKAEDSQEAKERAELELLMTDENPTGVERLDHFDFGDILLAEKLKKKKNKGKKTTVTLVGLQDGFKMNVGEDDRFKGVFENHDFAIDPSNKNFKATAHMSKLLEEGRRKRKGSVADEESADRGKKQRKVQRNEALAGLVESVKRKSGVKR